MLRACRVSSQAPFTCRNSSRAALRTAGPTERSRAMATYASGSGKAQTRSQSAAQSAVSEEDGTARVPLRLVVKDAVKRWFHEAHKEAVKGDVKQQALLGQMLVEGYGCKQNPELGREWTDKARRRNYKMSGVYCEL